jgi:hypothetical protein
VERFPHLGPPLLNFKSYLVSCSTLYAELKWRTETHQYKSSDIRLKLVTLLSQNQVRTTEESRVCPHESVAVRRRSVGGRSAAVPVHTQTYAYTSTFVLDTVLIPLQVSPRYFPTLYKSKWRSDTNYPAFPQSAPDFCCSKFVQCQCILRHSRSYSSYASVPQAGPNY